MLFRACLLGSVTLRGFGRDKIRRESVCLTTALADQLVMITDSENRHPPVNASEEESNGYTCRICLEDDLSRSDVIAPCACRGGSKWVHRSCLDRWRSMREDKAFSRCTECLQYYQLICTTNETCQEKCLRRTRFTAYVCRDFTFLLICTQLMIFSLAGFTYLIDHNSHYLLKLFHMDHYPFLFYYLFGLFLSFSLIGMIGSCIQSQCCGDTSNMNCYCTDIVFLPYFGPADSSPCCCCADSAACTQCGGCGSCECANCLSAGAIGEEALYLFLVLLVLFAIIGLFVFIFVGAMLMQEIVRRHFHILDKWNLTREFIVKDLAPGALPIAFPHDHDVRPYHDVEANIEMPSYTRLETMSAISPMTMNRGDALTDLTRAGESFESDEHPPLLEEPTAPPMESLAPQQRAELIRRGLL